MTTLTAEPHETRTTTSPARDRFGRYAAAVPIAIVSLFAVYPLIRVLVQAVRTPYGEWSTDAVGQVLSSPTFWTSLRVTVEVAVLSTVGCLILGTVVATLIAFAPFPGSSTVSKSIDSIVALPSFLIVLAFIFVYGGSGIASVATGLDLRNFLSSQWGIVAAEITFFTPFVLRPVLAAYAQFPTAQLNAAASLGASPWRVFTRVILPEIVPAVTAGGGLTLLLTLNEFGIVAFTGAQGAQTIPIRIYTAGIVTADIPAAAVYACVQIVLSLALYFGYRAGIDRLQRTPKRGGR